MPNRPSARASILAAAAALLPALLGTAALAQPVAAAPATKACSTAGLHYTQKRGGATFSVGVANLRAKGVACLSARTLAATVAKDLLHEAKLPARIGGLPVTLKEPCAGCTPTTQVSAGSGKELVTFVVKGGV